MGQENLNKSKFKQLHQELPTPNVYRTASGAPGHEYYQQKADYIIDVELDEKNNILSGNETITYTNNSPDILNYLDLVCLGTICDVVPVIGLNRAIVKQGLKIFGKRKNIGLKTLYDNSKIKNQPNTYHLGYLIGPKINAGGRVGKSTFGAELLISDNQEKVDYLAKEQNNFNEKIKVNFYTDSICFIRSGTCQ